MTDTTSDTKTVTWLHLSDLHMCNPKTGWEADYIIEMLQKDFTKMQEQHGLVPDMIFFTGDAAFGQLGAAKGKSLKDQFDDAEYVFMEIRESFKPQIPQENFFIVPGNHDIDRSVVNEKMHKGFDAEMKGDYDLVERQLSDILKNNGPEYVLTISGVYWARQTKGTCFNMGLSLNKNTLCRIEKNHTTNTQVTAKSLLRVWMNQN